MSVLNFCSRLFQRPNFLQQVTESRTDVTSTIKDSGIADLLTPKDTPYSLPKDISPKAKPVKPQEEERFRDESPASVRKIEKPPLISPDLPPDFTERYLLFD